MTGMVISFFGFIFGSVVGSFLNVVIERLHTGEKIIHSRSHCPKCGKVLHWYELIPLVSFFIQRGRCRGCGEAISLQYPLVELVTGGLFGLLIVNPPAGGQLSKILLLWAIVSGLIVIFVYDLRRYIIPDKILYPLIGVVVLARLFRIWNFNNFEFVSDFGFRISDFNGLFNATIIGLLTAAFFFALWYLSRGRAMGFGDVKLAFFMGLFLGWPQTLVAVFLAFILGGIIGVTLILGGRKKLKSQVPFGPFLVTGTLLALFWGDKLWNFYFNLLS